MVRKDVTRLTHNGEGSAARCQSGAGFRGSKKLAGIGADLPRQPGGLP